MKLRQVIIFFISVAILGGSYLLMQYLASQKTDPPQKPKTVAKRYVKTVPVKYSSIDTEIEAFGRVISSQPLTLSSEVAGRLVTGNVPLKAGQKFGQGDLLAKIDDTEQKILVQSSKTDFSKLLATALPELKIDFPDRYPVWESFYHTVEPGKPLPEFPEFTSSQERTFIITRDLYKSYLNARSAEVRLQKHYLYAPYSGSFSQVQLQAGSFVNPGSGIASIVRTDQIEMEVPVESQSIQWLKIGTEVKMASKNGMQQWKGRISRIGDVVNQATQSINVYIQVFRNENPIFDGLYLEATMPGYTLERAMSIPRNALVDQDKVFTVVNDTMLRLANVQVLKVNAETVYIAGLPEDTDLVVEPMVNAYNNMTVYKLGDSPRKLNMEITAEDAEEETAKPDKKAS